MIVQLSTVGGEQAQRCKCRCRRGAEVLQRVGQRGCIGSLVVQSRCRDAPGAKQHVLRCKCRCRAGAGAGAELLSAE